MAERKNGMINGEYHYNGVDKDGYAIIIDIADLTGYGDYEVMAMRNKGAEIACECYQTLDEAVKSYNAMIDRYALKYGENPPLKGKYAKLRDDLKAALAVAEQAGAEVDDSGTCNMDAASLALPRWREAIVEQAAEEAGTGCFKWESFGGGRYVFIPRVAGQAYKREIAAEAMTAELKRRGYDAFTYCQMD